MSNVRSITPNDPANFTPELGNYKTLQPFRYWCQKVLPLVYDDSLSYYELLCKVVDYLNKTMEDVETLHGDVTNLHKAYVKLQSYVNNYFSTLDVQEEINKKLDEMAKDGTLGNIIMGKIANYHTWNVLDYGVKGDGITDDTNAIQEIFDTVPCGYNVYFPSGTYIITKGLTINKPINITGNCIGLSPSNNIDCYSTIRLLNPKAGTTLLTVNSGWANISSLKFWCEECCVMTETGNVPSSTNHFRTRYFHQLIANINGIDFSQSINLCTIKNCSFIGFSGYTINSNIYGIISNCLFHYNMGTCILNSDILMSDCVFSYDELPLTVQGNGCVIDNVHIDEPCSYGIVINGSYNVITNIYIDRSCYSAIKMNYSLNNMIQGCVLRCCSYWTNTDFDDIDKSNEHLRDYYVIQVFGKNGGYHNINLSISNFMTFDDNHSDPINPMLLYIDDVTSRIFVHCTGLYKVAYPIINNWFVHGNSNYDVTVNYDTLLMRFTNGNIYYNDQLKMTNYNYENMSSNVITDVNGCTYFKMNSVPFISDTLTIEYNKVGVFLGLISAQIRGTSKAQINSGGVVASCNELTGKIPKTFNSGYCNIYYVNGGITNQVIGTLNVENGALVLRTIGTIPSDSLVICNALINTNLGAF
jgi:hypothetical protein